MADYDPTYGGKLIVGIGAQSDKDTAAGALTYFYCKPASTIPKVSLGYKREKFAGGGRIAASFKSTGDGTNKPKLIIPWTPGGPSDTVLSTAGIGAALAAPQYVTLEYNLIGSGQWTVIGAMCGMAKLTGKKSQGFWQWELDYDAIHPPIVVDAPTVAPVVTGTFLPLLWPDFNPATLLNGASGVTRIGDVTVELNHNLATYPGNNQSAFPSDCIPTDPDVKFTTEMLFVNLLAYKQFLNTAQAAGAIALDIGGHQILMSNMEYITDDPDAMDINKPSIEKITAESIPNSPTAAMLAVA